MYESRSTRPLTRPEFHRRLLGQAAWVLALLVGSLLLGIAGYMGFEHLSMVDAFLNAAMLLGGMGPVNPPQTVAGKVFAGCYALYAGLVFIVTAAMMFSPFLHRLLHHFHWDDKAR
jgi:hypothetical protein